MKHKLILFLILLSGFLLFCFPPDAFAVDTLFSGTGQAISSSPVIDTMASEAVSEAKISYEKSGGSASTAKVVFIMENVNDQSTTLVSKIRATFGPSVPILGIQIPWADYTPFTIESIPALDTTKSVSIMVLGGSSITVTYASGIGNFNSNSNAEATIGGKDLATKLHPQTGMNNLILIMGPQHGDLSSYVVGGMKQILGSPLPQNVKIVGWAGPYWGGNIYDNGVLKGNQIQGIMLSGNFKWAIRGIDHGNFGWDGVSGPDLGDPVTEIAKRYTQINTELGANASAWFMVIAHPDRSLFPAIRDRVAQVIGTSSMIGMHGGSEVGHDTTQGDVIAAGSHFFLAGIAPPGTTNPTATPINISPTQPPHTGDANGDGSVNGKDYIIWLNHYGTTTTLGSSVGDFNNDGTVNGKDYILWLNNYGA